MKARWPAVLAAVACLAHADPPPEFADERGEVTDVLAARAFLEREAAVEALYAAAQHGDAHATLLWRALEAFTRDLGNGIADRATEPHCLVLPVGCTPDWSKLDALSKMRPGGIRLRQVLAETFTKEARQRGLQNRLAVSLANSILAGVVIAGALRVAELPVASAGLGRSARLEELARDPAHGGAISPKTLREAEVALELERARGLQAPVVRDPTGGADFIDGAQQAWDVKAFTSKFPPRKGGFGLNDAMGKVKNAFDTGENVILDTANLTTEHLSALKAELRARGWEGRVRYWPP